MSPKSENIFGAFFGFLGCGGVGAAARGAAPAVLDDASEP
jgi:hypothetical protein